MLENLLEEIDRLTRLVTQLLFLCREDAGLAAGSPATVRLDEIVRDVANHMQVLAREKGLSLESRTSPPCSVHGERRSAAAALLQPPRQRHQVHAGGAGVSGYRANAPTARPVVVDGFGDRDLPPSTCPGSSIASTASIRRGAGSSTGPGWDSAICRSIAEAHGGRLEIGSTPGRGTKVTLTLPSDGRRAPR